MAPSPSLFTHKPKEPTLGIELSELTTAAENGYKAYEILDGGEVIASFQPLLKLPKAVRTEVVKAVDFKQIVMDLIEAGPDIEDDRDLYDLMREALRLVCNDDEMFSRLEEKIGDKPLVWKYIFEEYEKLTNPGEAKPSGE